MPFGWTELAADFIGPTVAEGGIDIAASDAAASAASGLASFASTPELATEAELSGFLGNQGISSAVTSATPSAAAQTVTGATPASVPTPAGPAPTTFNPEMAPVNTPMEGVPPSGPSTSGLTPEEMRIGSGPFSQGTGISVPTEGANIPADYTPPSPLQKGMQDAGNWLSNNKGLAITGGILALSKLGANRPTTFTTPGQSAPMNTGYYNLNPATFQPGRMPVTQNPVKPTYANYQQNPYQPTYMAQGGITSFSNGGMPAYKDAMEQQQMLQQYESMLTGQNNPYTGSSTSQQAVPSWVTSSGIVTDTDPTTSKMSALEAARYERAKVLANAGMPTSAGIGLASLSSQNYGSINTDPAMVQAAMAAQQQQAQGAAQGGIMGYAGGGAAQYNLGGYASGGNPRLLKGPGDGMSDNIPATIAGRQPARLADGEFVVPADVVSHLGNGSTDAGAEKLHAMMNKVRQKRTGKKKQAPAINPDQMIPS
jgi:hypothetical protein